MGGKKEGQEENHEETTETLAVENSPVETPASVFEPFITESNNQETPELKEIEDIKQTEGVTPLANTEEDDHNILVSGYLESITQSNEMISPATSESTIQPTKQEETPLLSFTEWLKRKDFPREDQKENKPSSVNTKSEAIEDSAPIVATLLYVKEEVKESLASAPSPATKSDNSSSKNVEVTASPTTNASIPTQTGRTLRTNEELGLKEVIRPIKKEGLQSARIRTRQKTSRRLRNRQKPRTSLKNYRPLYRGGTTNNPCQGSHLQSCEYGS